MQHRDFIYWIDANLPPRLADLQQSHLNVQANHLLEFDMLTTSDEEFSAKSKAQENVIIITKMRILPTWYYKKNSHPGLFG